MVNLERCKGSFNNLDGTSGRTCVSNKSEDLNLSVSSRTTTINESKTSTKDISCKCKCKFDGRKCDSNQKRNNDTCW